MSESCKDYFAIFILVLAAVLTVLVLIAAEMFLFFVIMISMFLAIAGLIWALDRVSDF